MKLLRGILLSLLVGATLYGQEANDPLPLNWQPSFSTISASKADNALVLLIITNADPFSSADDTAQQDPNAPANQAPPNQKKTPLPTPDIWCANALTDSCRHLIQARPDLEDRLQLQSISAGIPSQLSGGVPRNQPERAIVLVCDGSYRLLAIRIGVPDSEDLITLIEDAEDVRAIRELNPDNPKRVVEEVALRNEPRLSRLWKTATTDLLKEMDGILDVDTDPNFKKASNGRIHRICSALEPTYLADVELRFGLSDASDRTRLVVLEQHTESRRPWCESATPLLIGVDASIRWRELVESLWGHAATMPSDDHRQLLEWYDTNLKSGAVVFMLQPPIHRRHLPWPPVTAPGTRRGITWQQVHDLALEHSFRQLDAGELAALIRDRNLRPVDIMNPSMARYLMISPGSDTVNVVREQDPPGRFASQLKRSKSSLRSK